MSAPRPSRRAATRRRPPPCDCPVVTCATCGALEVPVLPFSKEALAHWRPGCKPGDGEEKMCPDRFGMDHATVYAQQVKLWSAGVPASL